MANVNILDKKRKDRQREALPSDDMISRELEMAEIKEKPQTTEYKISLSETEFDKPKKKQLSITIDDTVETVMIEIMNEMKWKKKNISKFINIVLINYLKSDPEIIALAESNLTIKRHIESI